VGDLARGKESVSIGGGKEGPAPPSSGQETFHKKVQKIKKEKNNLKVSKAVRRLSKKGKRGGEGGRDLAVDYRTSAARTTKSFISIRNLSTEIVVQGGETEG